MDGRGGCCIARYAGGGGAYDTSKMNRIMLRFRPIAPKPATSGSVSGGTSPEKSDSFVGTGRTKRRYVRDQSNSGGNNNSKKCCRKRKSPAAAASVVTLPLLPEKPDHQKDLTDEVVVGSSSSPPPPSPLDLTVESKSVQYVDTPIWMMNCNNNNMMMMKKRKVDTSSSGYSTDHPTVVMSSSTSGSTDRTVVVPQPVRPVGSCVVVGCVTSETFMGGDQGEYWGTDVEKRCRLERDTCPGFISDGQNRVRWTNEAYRKMVLSEDYGVEGEVARPEMVWLVVKERLPVDCLGFTCRVRLQYTCKKERSSLTVPCDVWRMDCGGFAWRLDVKAALSLGR